MWDKVNLIHFQKWLVQYVIWFSMWNFEVDQRNFTNHSRSRLWHDLFPQRTKVDFKIVTLRHCVFFYFANLKLFRFEFAFEYFDAVVLLVTGLGIQFFTLISVISVLVLEERTKQFAIQPISKTHKLSYEKIPIVKTNDECIIKI